MRHQRAQQTDSLDLHLGCTREHFDLARHRTAVAPCAHPKGQAIVLHGYAMLGAMMAPSSDIERCTSSRTSKHDKGTTLSKPNAQSTDEGMTHGTSSGEEYGQNSRGMIAGFTMRRNNERPCRAAPTVENPRLPVALRIVIPAFRFRLVNKSNAMGPRRSAGEQSAHMATKDTHEHLNRCRVSSCKRCTHDARTRTLDLGLPHVLARLIHALSETGRDETRQDESTPDRVGQSRVGSRVQRVSCADPRQA